MFAILILATQINLRPLLYCHMQHKLLCDICYTNSCCAHCCAPCALHTHATHINVSSCGLPPTGAQGEGEGQPATGGRPAGAGGILPRAAAAEGVMSDHLQERREDPRGRAGGGPE